MAESAFKGKNMKLVAIDVSEGFVSINPLFLKKFDKEMLKDLFENLTKTLNGVRTEKLLPNDPDGLRRRTMKLQRLHNAMIILKNIAREKRMPL